VGASATPFFAEHLKSLQAFPPRQAADTLSLHKALEGAMAKLENANASSN
jgi:arylsulfatase